MVGFCGAIPCCPFPNPFRNVQQGVNWYLSVIKLDDLTFFFFNFRFRRSCLTFWPILQISRPRFGASKRLHRISPNRRRQNPNSRNWSSDSYVCSIYSPYSKIFSPLKIQLPLFSTRDNVNVEMYGSFSLTVTIFVPSHECCAFSQRFRYLFPDLQSLPSCIWYH